MTGFELGPIKVENGVLCAPICGATKYPYRLLAREYGADLCYTEMIKAIALVKGTERSFELAAIAPGERPVGAQICGGDPELMRQAAEIIGNLGFDTLDINMGCPVPKIVKQNAGAALMRDPGLVERVVKAVADAVDIPVTVKIRSGWTKSSVNAVDVSKAAEQGGAKMVSIHGRPRSHRHSGEIDYETIAQVKQNVSMPVIGNGGIFEPEDARVMVDRTGCDGVMIGRGGYGRPWFFRDCANALKGEPAGPLPGPDDLHRIMLEHFHGILAALGEGTGVRSFRKCCAWYFKDVPYGASFRDMAFRASTQVEVEEILQAWIDHLKACEHAAEAGEPITPPAILGDLHEGSVPPWMYRASRCQKRVDDRDSKLCAQS